jgi:hypothetical protein
MVAEEVTDAGTVAVAAGAGVDVVWSAATTALDVMAESSATQTEI